MDIDGLLKKFSSQDACRALLKYRDEGRAACYVSGVNSSAGSFVISALSSSFSGVTVVIAGERETAANYCGDLYSLAGDGSGVYYFPSSFSVSSSGVPVPDDSQKVQRTAAIKALGSMKKRDSLILVTYPHAIMEGLISEKEFAGSVLSLKKGDTCSHQQIRDILFENGFEKVDFVSEPGQFALRGSIIDLFSYADNLPYRLDFFGDEIESIKRFDINSQRSVESVDSVDVYPNICAKGDGSENRVSVFDYLSEHDINIVFDDRTLLESRLDIIGENHLPGCIDPSVLKEAFGKYFSVHFTRPSCEYSEVAFSISPQPSFNKNFEILASDIRKREEDGYTVYILSDNQSQIERLRHILTESKFNLKFTPVNSSVHEGFIDNITQTVLYTDHQIFDRYHRVRLKRSVEKSERLTINDLNSFQIGDYIVHIDHGVGIYGGLVKTNVNGKYEEAVKIIYKDKDVIYVSVHSLHRISRYRSKDGTPPKIYKLGSGAWQKLKTQAKKKVKDIARDLIRLYSERKNAKGFAFSPDTYMQHELEASFFYEDTPDQTKATEAVKSDMEKTYPMDRLVCGDVGFGKTEVSIRAAFKAVADSKQVAVLVPTTILALQHYNTYKSRLANFPCNVEFLSRLKSPKETKEIISRLSEGKIDILIGTHRLLGKEVKFKDLGLLIIDEEQKFGVAAKEKLRQMKVSVDTLTLTATPIPRTLQFSLLGARDLSIINTPPPNRLPVHTEIISFDEEVIRNIIRYEIDRGGQVFFVHNRVEDILAVEDMIRRIVPDIRTCVGHGQMDPSELEKKMLDFISGDYDVLIATSIVENGIDVPNANTIIVNQAQNFGLSDLHQLRGRVGRSNRKAYCYLVTPPMISLSDDSRRRLKAIEMFSELGSGFNIAMQDLDIRGAGNLLGGEQSGFIADMGFETYQRILAEAFEEIHEEESGAADGRPDERSYVTDPVIDADFELYIPDSYISNSAEKIRLYKEIDSMSDENQIIRFTDSLEDRFGKMPVPVRELVNVVRLRREASRLSMEKVVLKNGIMLAYFISDPASPFYQSDKFGKIMNVIKQNPGKLRLKEKFNKLYISVPDIKSVEDGYYVLKSITLL